MDFERIAVIGPGLLGGSILKALASFQGVTTSLWARRKEAVAEAHAAGIADLCSTDLSEVVQEADLVILATPIGVMPTLSQAMLPHLRTGVVITDVGSVKACVVEGQQKVLEEHPAFTFVGSHPMAGSEKLGLSESRSDLLNGAACLVTPHASSDVAIVARVVAFWEALQMQVYQMSPAEHDAIVASISHLPHVVAAILVQSALQDNSTAGKFVAGGFRDTTRIASGSPEMWTGILTENRLEVVAAMKRFQSKLGDLLDFLETMDEENVRRFLADAKDRRDAIL